MEENNIRTLVGAKIRQFRKEAGFTIEELASRAKLHYNYLGDIERGKRNPSLVNLKKISAGLSLPISELFPSKKEEALPAEKADDTYDYVRPLVKLFKDSPDKDKKYIVSVVKSLARHLHRGEK